MARNTVYTSVHANDPGDWRFSQLQDLGTVVVDVGANAQLFFTPENALDFARRLFDFAEPLVVEAESDDVGA